MGALCSCNLFVLKRVIIFVDFKAATLLKRWHLINSIELDVDFDFFGGIDRKAGIKLVKSSRT